MTAPAPTYRYWGSQKPQARTQPVAVASGQTAQMRIYEPIDSWGAPFGVSANEFGQALAELGGDVTSIELHMHSPGGDAFDGLAIMNQLRQHKAAVNIVVDGYACSAASVICMGADTVTMAPGAQMMIHNASGLAFGTSDDMETMAKRLDSLSGNYAAQYAARAGGSADDWRAAMTPESWYTADEAVQAGLADSVLSKADAPEQPKTHFDLAIFAHAGRELAPAPVMPAAKATQTPAEPPETPPTDHEESAVDIYEKVLRERLGISADASLDETAARAALDQALAERAEPDTTDEAIAKARSLTPEQVKAALDAAAKPAEQPKVPEGMTVVSEALLASLQAGAAAGIEARAKQHAEDRDKTISAALAAGKIGAYEKADWEAAYDRNPENATKELASLGKRYPTGPLPGTPGGDTADLEQPISDAEAQVLASMTGTSKEAFLR